ncbi:MAG: XRE family transcriptional regulator [Candidatus Kapaibacterium sp.]
MPRHIIHQPRYLGENLKRLRRSRDYTVERLAAAVGLSKGYLSMIETGKRSPHWTVVMRIVHALGETLCGFFTSAESIPPPEDGIRTRREDLILIEGDRPNERGLIPWPPANSYTYILTPLHPRLTSEVVEIFLPPHTEWTEGPIAFPGNVVCWCVQGRLLLVCGGIEYVMHEGETLSYDASRPHMLRNYTDHAARITMTIASVSF